MRKYFLGIVLALVFLAYSTILRHQHSRPVLAPTISQNSATPTTTVSYKDGTYTGGTENAFYGNLQVSATVQGGKITSVSFLQYPDDNPNSINVNQAAMPYLKQEAIKAQSANVSGVTGATYTSQAFIQSLSSALNQAKQG
jgi:uncharacterized protein with FMN-binding domain